MTDTRQKGSVKPETLDVVKLVKDDMELAINAIDDDAVIKLGTLLSIYIMSNKNIYFTGIGKPSYVAMKNAATLKSIEVKGEYLDACTAGHGDLGSMPNEALVIAMSKSGKSSELLTLFKNLSSCRPKVDIVLLTLSNDIDALTELYKEINEIQIISLNVNPNELDLAGLIPSSSNVVFEAAIGISIAAAMNAVGSKLDLYKRLQRSHPSGTLQTKVSNIIKMHETLNAQ